MPALCQTLQTSAVLALDLCEAAAHDLALWYQHEIQPANHLALVSTEAFTEKTLRPVAIDRAANPPPDGQTQAPEVPCVLRDK